jgi:hypothetical protein
MSAPTDVHKLIQVGLPSDLPARVRANSRKRLLMFRMEEPCKKRKIKLDANPRGPAIELLADGQQFVACGTHCVWCALPLGCRAAYVHSDD